jgi:uncharacterized protein
VSDTLLKSVLWQRPDLPALEVCRLWQVHEGFRFTGTVVARVDREPVEVTYEVVCDEQWATRLALVLLKKADSLRSVELHRDRSGQWFHNDHELPSFNGSMDVDLGFSPATNTLPVRRVNLAVGQTIETTAVWVTFPALDILPLPQTYTRLDERRYRYTSRGGEFSAVLELDELGLVVNYEEWWRRIAESLK